MTTKIPFTVIGGYLGAGKTTLLNHLLSNTQGLRIAVLVNDFGSINIDASLIRSHEGNTINLANGCMCCSIADNFALVMRQLQERTEDFDHIVIEASGVARPAKIAQYGQMYRLPLDGVIVVADAEQVRTQAQNKYVGDTVLRQFNQADLIILNKTDLVLESAQSNLRHWFAEIAPGTPIVETVQAEVPISILLGRHQSHAEANLLSDAWPVSGEGDHRQQFETWTLEHNETLDRETLTYFAAGLGEGIYRAKGLIWLTEDPVHRYIYQQVGSRWSLEPDTEWGDAVPHSQLVVIGRKGSTSILTLSSMLHHQRCLT
jgi:G3E family GTPase